MDQFNDPRSAGPATQTAHSFAAIFIVSLLSVVLSFAVANSGVGFALKTGGFSMIVTAFLVVWVLLYFRLPPRATAPENEETQLERGLRALDEAREYFAGAIGVSDTFRLVMSRTSAIVPSSGGCLWLLDPSRTNLVCEEAVGDLSAGRKGSSSAIAEGLAGKCYAGASIARGTRSRTNSYSIAVPLIRDGTAFGVLEFVAAADKATDTIDDQIFEAVGSRVSPLILSAIAFDRSRANALTDPTTDLPNERAFFLILENQIAEATRRGPDRPLTILAIDVKNFDDINSRFGHTAGDAVLEFVARTIKESLRQMDFFARCRNDEFLAILPTAGNKVSGEVIERVQAGFLGRKVKVSEGESLDVDLNFGWAAFGEDGEAAEALIKTARARKADAKGVAVGNVLRFSRELVN